MKKYRAICPLIGFQLQIGFFPNDDRSSDELHAIFKERRKQIIDGIELVDGIKITLVTKQDILNFKEYALMSLSGIENYISTRDYLLEKVVEKEDERNNKTADEMRKIILSFRLLQEGRFFGDDVFYFTDEGVLKSWSREGAPLSSDLLGIGYALDFREIPELRKLINRVQRTDFEKRKNLDLACRHFQRAYKEYSDNNRLIDYLIAFEALFLKGKQRTYKKAEPIANACSKLLGNTDEEKGEIRDILSKAYSIRNSIIHEGEYVGDIEPFSIIEEIESYLRDSIVKFLN